MWVPTTVRACRPTATSTTMAARWERSRWEEMASLGDVMVGKRDGRRSAEQVTAYVGHGAGGQFAALGYLASQAATERDAGLAIPAGRFLQTIYQT